MNIFDVLVANKIAGGGGGGGGGDSNYNNLSNKPKINNITLSGNKTSSDLGIAEASDIEDLQSQIDAITMASDVSDIVATYAELMNYDTSELFDRNIIKVISDEQHNNAISYYRWIAADEEFEYEGSEGPFYTKSETNEAISDAVEEATQNMVTDVQINGTSIIDDCAANIQIAGSDRLGVVKQTTGYGITINSDGRLQIAKATDALIEGKVDNYTPIVPANMQKAFNTCIPNNTFITSQTTAPASAATDGGIHLVYLDSEPTTKYDGYLYFIKEA